MPNLLIDDARDARLSEFDQWVDEQKQRAQQLVEPAVQAVQQAPQALSDASNQRLQEFDQWVTEQNAARAAQQATQAPTTPQPAPPAPAAPTQPEQPQQDTGQQQRLDAFDQWVQQQNAQQPPLAAPATPTAPSQPAATPDQQTQPSGQGVTNDGGSYVFPVQGYQGKVQNHWGEVLGGSDLMAARGTPIVAMKSGKVLESGWNDVGGNSLLVQGDDGNQYYYAHFDQPSALQVGQRVNAGDYVAPVGNTGDAANGPPHLHIGIGPDIKLGRDKYGGTGGDYNAVGLLQNALEGNGPSTLTKTTAEMSGGGDSGGLTDRATQILSGAADAARAFGGDAAKAVQAVLVTEGGLNGARGDNGTSAGPLQFFEGGQLANFARQAGLGLDEAKAFVEQHPLEAIAWALGGPTNPGYLGLAIQRGMSEGLQGRDLATFIQRTGQVSDSPERAGANYDAMFGRGQDLVRGAQAAAQGGLDTLGRASGDVATRAQDLATASGDLLRRTGSDAQASVDALNQTQQRIADENARYFDARRADLDRRRQDLLAPRDLPTLMGPNQAIDQGTSDQSFLAPLTSGLGDAKDALQRGDIQSALDAINKTQDDITKRFSAPDLTPVTDWWKGQTTEAQDLLDRSGLSPGPPLDVTRPLGPQLGFDPYGAIVQRGLPQVARGIQQGNVGDILGGVGETLGGAASVLPGEGFGAMAGPSLVEQLAKAPVLRDVLGSEAGASSAVRDFLTGTGSESGSVGPIAGVRMGGAAAGVLGSEATMSDEDKQDPWGRISRDLGFGIAGAAAPETAMAIARRGGPVNWSDLRQLHTTQQPLMNVPQRQTVAQFLSAFGKNNLLSGPGTQISNIFSQLIELARLPAERAAGGYSDEAVAGLKTAAQALPDAFRNAIGTMRSGRGQFAPPPSGQATPAYWFALRALGAADDFFRTIGYAMGSGMEGQRFIRENPGQAAQRVLQGNQAAIDAAGNRAARLSVFAEGNGPGQVISDLKQRLMSSSRPQDQVAGMALDAGVPFSSVPGRIWTAGIRRLPGVAESEALGRAGIAVGHGDERAARLAMGGGLISSVINTSIISNIMNGNITGPEDKEHPTSMKINGQWVDYSRWGPYMLPIALPAAWVESARKEGNKPNPDQVKAFYNATFKTMANQFYAADLIKVLSQVGEGNAAGATGQLAGSYIDRYLPAGGALNFATQAWDPILRDTSNKGLAQFVEREQAKIPGLAQMLPAQPSMTSGEPEQRLRSGLGGTLLGMQTRPVSDLDAEVNRLEKLGYSLPNPTKAPTEVASQGARIPLSEAEGRELTFQRGQAIDKVLGPLVASAAFQRLTDDQKASAIASRLANIDNDTARNWERMTPVAERNARIREGRTVAGRKEPVGASR